MTAAGPVPLSTLVKARGDRGVLQVDASDTTVVVVHGDVEQPAAHLHGDGVAVGNVVVGVRRVGRPRTCTVAVRDDPLPELAEVVEVCTAHHQVRAVGPEFVEDVAGVAGQSVASLPSGVPRVGVLVVSSDTVFGGKQRFSVVLHDATDGELKVRPCVDQVAVAVVQFKFQLAP